MNSSEWNSFIQKATAQHLREPNLDKFTKSPLSSPSWPPVQKEAQPAAEPMSLLQMAEACQPATYEKASRIFDKLMLNFESSLLWRLKSNSFKEKSKEHFWEMTKNEERRKELVSHLLLNPPMLRDIEKNLKSEIDTLWFPITSNSLTRLSLFLESAPWRKNQQLENLRKFLLFKVINDRLLKSGDHLHLVVTISPNDYMNVSISCGRQANKLWPVVFQSLGSGSRFLCPDLFFFIYNAKTRLSLARKLHDVCGTYLPSTLNVDFASNLMTHSIFSHNSTGVNDDYAVSYNFPYSPSNRQKLDVVLQRATNYSVGKGLFLSFEFNELIKLGDVQGLIHLLPAAKIITRLQQEQDMMADAELYAEKIEMFVKVPTESRAQDLIKQIDRLESVAGTQCIWRYQLPGQGDDWSLYRRPVQRPVSRKFLF